MAKVKSYMNPNIPKPKPDKSGDGKPRRITNPMEPPRRGERPGPAIKVPAKPMPKPKPKPRFRPRITKGGR